MSSQLNQIGDEELMRLVADTRSHKAFEALYARHEKKSFMLAYHLCGNRDAAREAVQEAMLTVWLKAKKFDPKRGETLKWVLRIVANSVLKARRSHVREMRWRVDERVQNVNRRANEAKDSSESVELKREVARALEKLPPRERQLLALYFGAGFSQRKISKCLALPQTTISKQISNALALMRGQLVRAGFASMTATIISMHVASLFKAGSAAPAGLKDMVLNGISRNEQPAKENAKARGSGVVSLWLSGCFIVAVLIAFTFVGFRPIPNKEATANFVVAGGSTTMDSPALATRTVRPMYHKKWDFNTPAPRPVFEVTGGSWRHVPTPRDGSSGYMITDSKAKIRLNLPELRWPYAVTLTFKKGASTATPGGRKVPFNGKSSIELSFHPEGLWKRGLVYNFKNPWNRFSVGNWHTLHVRSIEQFMITTVAHQKAISFVDTKPNAKLYILIYGTFQLAGMEVRELPEATEHDFDTLRQAIHAIPLPQREGVVTLTGVTPYDPKETVQVNFNQRAALGVGRTLPSEKQ